jgi:hypothetical protein
MSLANRSFKNNKTGEIIRVIDSFENIAVLENKQKVDVRTLTDVNYYTEQIDPKNFFNTQGAYNLLADKIKNIPQSVLSNFNDENTSDENIYDKFGSDITPQMNESAIIMSTEEDEKAELARKYGVSLDTESQVSRQNEAFARILGEDAEDELPVVPKQYVEQPPVVRVEAERPIVNTERPIVNEYNPAPVVVVEDPIITMFKNVKRSKDFSISLEINNKIPRPDFIEMMEDSYNTSIIDFLASEFTDNLLKNPQIIEDMIKEKIKELVYGEVVETETKVNDQITDSVTQVNSATQMPGHRNPPPPPSDRILKEGELPTKPKATRKPRPNTAQGEKPGYKKPTRTKKESTEK